jgi:hypothetical protein
VTNKKENVSKTIAYIIFESKMKGETKGFGKTYH